MLIRHRVDSMTASVIPILALSENDAPIDHFTFVLVGKDDRVYNGKLDPKVKFPGGGVDERAEIERYLERLEEEARASNFEIATEKEIEGYRMTFERWVRSSYSSFDDNIARLGALAELMEETNLLGVPSEMRRERDLHRSSTRHPKEHIHRHVWYSCPVIETDPMISLVQLVKTNADRREVVGLAPQPTLGMEIHKGGFVRFSHLLEAWEAEQKTPKYLDDALEPIKFAIDDHELTGVVRTHALAAQAYINGESVTRCTVPIPGMQRCAA